MQQPLISDTDGMEICEQNGATYTFMVSPYWICENTATAEMCACLDAMGNNAALDGSACVMTNAPTDIPTAAPTTEPPTDVPVPAPTPMNIRVALQSGQIISISISTAALLIAGLGLLTYFLRAAVPAAMYVVRRFRKDPIEKHTWDQKTTTTVIQKHIQQEVEHALEKEKKDQDKEFDLSSKGLMRHRKRDLSGFDH